MSLNYEKVVKGLSLLLFLSSSILAFIKSNPLIGLIAVLSVIMFLSFEVLCYFKDLPKKESDELVILKHKISELETQMGEMKNDHSLAHLASTFKRSR